MPRINSLSMYHTIAKIHSYAISHENEALENLKTMSRFILAQTLGRLKPSKVLNLRKHLPKITGILPCSPSTIVQFHE